MGNNAAIMWMLNQQRMEADAERARQSSLDARAAADRKAQEKKMKVDKKVAVKESKTKVRDSYLDIYNQGKDKLKSLGVRGDNYNNIITRFKSNIDHKRKTLPTVVDNPGDVFNGLFDDAYNSVRGDTQAHLRGDLNNKYRLGDGVDKSTFADTDDDKYIETILADQGKNALSDIEMAYKRGTMNDVGRAAALAEYDNQTKAGRSNANALGGGVLAGYRDDLRHNIDDVNQRIDKYDFTDNIDLGAESNRIGSTVAGHRNSMEGDILAALNGTSLYDNKALVHKGGASSGMFNGINTLLPANEGGTAGAGSPLAPDDDPLKTKNVAF